MDLLPVGRASMARGRREGAPRAQCRIEAQAARDHSDRDRQDGRAALVGRVAPAVPATVRHVQAGSGPAGRAPAASAPMDLGPMGRAPAASARMVPDRMALVPAASARMDRVQISTAEPESSRAALLAPPGASGSPTTRGLPSRPDHAAAQADRGPTFAAPAPATARVPASRRGVRSARVRVLVRGTGQTRRAICRAKAPVTSDPRRARSRDRAALPGRAVVVLRALVPASAPDLGRVEPGLDSAPIAPRAPRPGASPRRAASSIATQWLLRLRTFPRPPAP
jgi:hypothetical protein